MIKDLKYLMSYSIAVTAFIGILVGGPFVYLTFIYTFVFIPILESNTKEYLNEYSDDEKKSRNLDPFFDFLLYLNIPIVYGIFFVSLNTLLNTDSAYEIIGIILSASIVMATNGINVGHELGQAQYAEFKIKSAVLSNLNKLKNSNTFTVTTGHQLNLFGGPLYFIYKIVTVINLVK